MSSEIHSNRTSIEICHPFRLRRINLKNFKSVDRATVELRPLSVVVGANSSGKSTLLQVALAGCQAVRSADSSTDFPLNGELQNLDTYEDIHSFQSSGTDEPIQFGFRVVESWDSESWTDTDESANTGLYTLRWSMNLIKSANPQGGRCQIESQSITISGSDGLEDVIANLISHSGRVVGQDAEVNPILNSLRPAQPRVEYYAGIWWNSLRHYLSSIIDRLKRDFQSGKIEIVGLDPSSTSRIDDPLGILANVAIRDLKDARPFIENSLSKSLDVDSDIWSLKWDFANWCYDRFKGPFDYWDESLTTYLDSVAKRTLEKLDQEAKKHSLLIALAILLLGSNKAAFQARIRHGLQHDCWWEEDRKPALHELGTYRRGDEDSWTVIGLVNEILEEFFGSKVSYLGPLRKSPRGRTSSDPRPGKDLGTSGEYAEAVLNSQAGQLIRVPLPDGYENELSLGEALNLWLEWFGLADDASVQDRGRYGFELNVRPPGASRSVYLSAVGVGVSQVLPVILLCLLSEPADLLILEQPELHLHPALQKRLADFLLVFVRAGRQILVETHSDHLVNQLRYQVAADETDETRKLVKLIFAEQTDGITTYRESEINEYGGLSEDWPDGFLDISAKSAQDLVRHGLRKWKLRKPRPGDAN